MTRVNKIIAIIAALIFTFIAFGVVSSAYSIHPDYPSQVQNVSVFPEMQTKEEKEYVSSFLDGVTEEYMADYAKKYYLIHPDRSELAAGEFLASFDLAAISYTTSVKGIETIAAKGRLEESDCGLAGVSIPVFVRFSDNDKLYPIVILKNQYSYSNKKMIWYSSGYDNIDEILSGKPNAEYGTDKYPVVPMIAGGYDDYLKKADGAGISQTTKAVLMRINDLKPSSYYFGCVLICETDKGMYAYDYMDLSRNGEESLIPLAEFLEECKAYYENSKGHYFGFGGGMSATIGFNKALRYTLYAISAAVIIPGIAAAIVLPISIKRRKTKTPQ